MNSRGFQKLRVFDFQKGSTKELVEISQQFLNFIICKLGFAISDLGNLATLADKTIFHPPRYPEFYKKANEMKRKTKIRKDSSTSNFLVSTEDRSVFIVYITNYDATISEISHLVFHVLVEMHLRKDYNPAISEMFDALVTLIYGSEPYKRVVKQKSIVYCCLPDNLKKEVYEYANLQRLSEELKYFSKRSQLAAMSIDSDTFRNITECITKKGLEIPTDAWFSPNGLKTELVNHHITASHLAVRLFERCGTNEDKILYTFGEMIRNLSHLVFDNVESRSC